MSLMQRMTQQLQRGHAEASATLNTVASRRQRGASAIEYVIILGVIAVAIFLAANFGDLQDTISGIFDEVNTELSD
ncbi:MAG: Flp family type IVb pilin [Pseudomonadota bacterium]